MKTSKKVAKCAGKRCVSGARPEKKACRKRKKLASVAAVATPIVNARAFDLLHVRQQAFVREYLRDFNATRAAIAAGYSAKTARSIGNENLTKPDIAAAVRELMDESGISRERIMQEVARMAFRVDLADFDLLHRGKTLAELRELGVDTSLIKKIKTRTEVEGRGEEGVQYVVREIELRDRLGALEMRAKLAGLLDKERGEAGGNRSKLFTADNLAGV
ncbi:MAG: terminase small subunit [bacterium]|nr:terminase small subunit [bacterium]